MNESCAKKIVSSFSFFPLSESNIPSTNVIKPVPMDRGSCSKMTRMVEIYKGCAEDLLTICGRNCVLADEWKTGEALMGPVKILAFVLFVIF